MGKRMDALKETLDFYTHRYQIFIVTDEQDKQACLALRKKIFGVELKRSVYRKGVNPSAGDDFDRDSILIACRDKKTAKIIGCARLTPAELIAKNAHQRDIYKLNCFDKALLPHIVTLSRFIIAPKHRKTAVGYNIVLGLYQYVLDHPNYELAVLVCDASLYSLYSRLGFFPYERRYNSGFGSYRIPLVAHAHDYARFKHCKSPVLRYAKKRKFPKAKHGLEWLFERRFDRQQPDPQFRQITANYHQIKSPLFDGISDEGKRTLLKKAIELKCSMNECIVKKEFGGKMVGLVMSGALKLVAHGKTVAIKQPGDVFGEASFILDNAPRDTDIIVAAPETTIITLSPSSIKGLRSMRDQSHFWRNIARLMARRIKQMDKQVEHRNGIPTLL